MKKSENFPGYSELEPMILQSLFSFPFCLHVIVIQSSQKLFSLKNDADIF